MAVRLDRPLPVQRALPVAVLPASETAQPCLKTHGCGGCALGKQDSCARLLGGCAWLQRGCGGCADDGCGAVAPSLCNRRPSQFAMARDAFGRDQFEAVL